MNRLRRLLPDREKVHRIRWLKWLHPHLHHPGLWRWSRRGVAVGVALGVFFGLLIPIAQIPLAAGTALLLRANIPAAVSSTLVTNPVTFAPVYLFAHRLGAAILGDDSPPPPAVAGAAPKSWQGVYQQVLALGRPLLFGLAILAVCAGLLAYLLIMSAWRIRTAWTWKRRHRRRPNRS